jgi:GDP-mannose 6-dehydrogenase
METVSFVGLGVVGLVTQACVASRGINTIGVDSNNDKLKNLRSGKLPFYEPKLKEVMNDAGGKLMFSDNITYAVQNSDITFVTVGTPSKVDGGIDLSQISDVCKAIGIALKSKSQYHIVAIKSTVVPGTTDNFRLYSVPPLSSLSLSASSVPSVSPSLEGLLVEEVAVSPLVVQSHHRFTILNLFDLLLIKLAATLRQKSGYSNIASSTSLGLFSALKRTLYLSGYALVAERMIFDQ